MKTEEQRMIELAGALIGVINEHEADTLVAAGSLTVALLNIVVQSGIDKDAFLRAFHSQADHMYSLGGETMQ